MLARPSDAESFVQESKLDDKGNFESRDSGGRPGEKRKKAVSAKKATEEEGRRNQETGAANRGNESDSTPTCEVPPFRQGSHTRARGYSPQIAPIQWQSISTSVWTLWKRLVKSLKLPDIASDPPTIRQQDPRAERTVECNDLGFVSDDPHPFLSHILVLGKIVADLGAYRLGLPPRAAPHESSSLQVREARERGASLAKQTGTGASYRIF
ncbi:hypothetical protein C8R47DRAFT_1217402 [Mycena vitilis]|nr:hypothetical protein C8R47DRAFT_1217402 [Mycena vitilis]